MDSHNICKLKIQEILALKFEKKFTLSLHKTHWTGVLDIDIDSAIHIEIISLH